MATLSVEGKHFTAPLTAAHSVGLTECAIWPRTVGVESRKCITRPVAARHVTHAIPAPEIYTTNNLLLSDVALLS